MGARRTRLRLGFAGTPPFAASILQALIAHHDIAIVYSQPARHAGRGRKLAKSAVARTATSSGIAIRSPLTLRGEAKHLADFNLDALIVAAYGLLLPKDILDAPRHGCINVHASLLPRWRGAAPIERAIMTGDTETGISIMQMDEGLDTGPLLRQRVCAIEVDDTGDTLERRLAHLGAATLLSCLDEIEHLVPMSQPPAGITYAKKLTRADSAADWTASAQDLALKIRALNSRQPAFCSLEGRRMRLLRAEAIEGSDRARPGEILSIDSSGIVIACGTGALRITQVALSIGSGRPMDVVSLLNGHPELIRRGQVLGTST